MDIPPEGSFNCSLLKRLGIFPANSNEFHRWEIHDDGKLLGIPVFVLVTGYNVLHGSKSIKTESGLEASVEGIRTYREFPLNVEQLKDIRQVNLGNLYSRGYLVFYYSHENDDYSIFFPPKQAVNREILMNRFLSGQDADCGPAENIQGFGVPPSIHEGYSQSPENSGKRGTLHEKLFLAPEIISSQIRRLREWHLILRGVEGR
ncbi:hypothetical protein HYU13_05680 [Candidatus Woesearchaeota archaeon]|nr:hypothetical protein [Candidatus Woesearchaeota archaeon]